MSNVNSHYYDLRGHTRLKMVLTWDVGQHDNDEAIVVVERHVIHVGKPHGVHSRSAYERQSSINGHQFPNDSQGVQDDEEVVSGKEKMYRVTNPPHTRLQSKFEAVKTHSRA